MKINLATTNINKTQRKSFGSISKQKEFQKEYLKKHDKLENINTLATGFGLIGLYLESKGRENIKKADKKVFKIANENMNKTRLTGIVCVFTSLMLLIYSCINRKNYKK